MMKFMKKATAIACCLCTAFSMVACGGGKFKGEEVDLENDKLSGTLNINLWKGGFGVEWLDNLIEAFNKKYPDVEITYDPSPERMTVFGNITGMGSEYDLIFQDAILMDYAEECMTPINDVYTYTNKGESTAVGDKMFDFYRDNLQLRGNYYQIPYAMGAYGIVYNCDVIDEIPVTTEELKALCTSIKTSIKPFIFSGEAGTGYWDFLYATWFAQYEGKDTYLASLSGQTINADGSKTYDPATAYLPGGLKAMQVCEDLLWYTNGNIVTTSTAKAFKVAQRDFLKGEAAMMYNGSWLFNEMQLLFPDGPEYDFKMMKVPVISAIKDKCTTIDNAAELASLVRAIDAGATSFDGVNEKDFATVQEARNFYYVGAEGATGCVPINARNKTLAKRFLSFMYSEEGIKVHAQSGVGCVLPVKNLNVTVETEDTFTESCYDIMLNNEVFCNTAVIAVTPYCTDPVAIMIENQFGAQNSKDRTRAADSFEDKKTLWTANDNKKFWDALINAGYITEKPAV